MREWRYNHINRVNKQSDGCLDMLTHTHTHIYIYIYIYMYTPCLDIKMIRTLFRMILGNASILQPRRPHCPAGLNRKPRETGSKEPVTHVTEGKERYRKHTSSQILWAYVFSSICPQAHTHTHVFITFQFYKLSISLLTLALLFQFSCFHIKLAQIPWACPKDSLPGTANTPQGVCTLPT